MSSVTVLQPPIPLQPSKIAAPNCHQCGADISYAVASAAAEDAQRRISELEAQVRILTGKATAAVDKLADYEDQLHQLRSTQSNPVRSPSPQILTVPPSRPTSSSSILPPPIDSTITTTTSRSRLPSRLTNLLRPPSAPSTPTYPPPSTTPPLPSTTPPPRLSSDSAHTNTSTSLSAAPADLLAQLSREQNLRQAAESKLSTSHAELEELSTQLFTEANEMVAAERKARAKLEMRVEVLEKRDREKKDRLAELEKRVGRVERVRGLLNSYA